MSSAARAGSTTMRASPLSITHAAAPARISPPPAQTGSAHSTDAICSTLNPTRAGGMLTSTYPTRVTATSPMLSLVTVTPTSLAASPGEIERFTHRVFEVSIVEVLAGAEDHLGVLAHRHAQRRVRILDRVGDRDTHELRTGTAVGPVELRIGAEPLVPKLLVHRGSVVPGRCLHARRDVPGLHDHDA